MAARKPILHLSLTAGTVDLSDLPRLDASFDSPSESDPHRPLSLADLFPDLAVYAGPAPSEEDKANRRLDEGHTSGRRIAHTSRLMDVRPVLVSSIQPAKNATDGIWELHDGLWYEDPRGSTDVQSETVMSTSSVFTGRSLKPLNPKTAPDVPPMTRHHLRPEHAWTDEEDLYLRRLVQTYPFHWQLIADSLASQILNVSSEKPSAYECWDRWYWQFGEGKYKQKPDSQVAPTPDAVSSAVPPTGALGSITVAGTPGDGSAPPSASATGSNARAAPTPQQTPVLSNTAPIQLPTTNGEATYEGQGPPPPGLSKREARQANKHKYEGTKKSIRHQVLYDSVRRLVRRREVTKQKTSGELPLRHNHQTLMASVKDQPKRVIQVHDSHSSYLMAQVGTPFELVEAKYQRDMRDRMERQSRISQMQEARAQAARQQAMLNVHQMRPPGPNRVGPNGQPLPNIAPSQQQLLNAVAAANAARQNGGAPNGTPLPNGRTPQSAQGQVQQVPNAQVMQMLQAQQMAARQAQAQAQQQSQAHGRVSSGGTPHSSNLSNSPYSQPAGELPNGDGAHGSPAMQIPAGPQSSPAQQAAAAQQQAVAIGRVPSMPMSQSQHLRVPSGGPSQLGNNGQQMPSPALNNAAMQQIIATLAASGQQTTPETVRSLQIQMMRNVRFFL